MSQVGMKKISSRLVFRATTTLVAMLLGIQCVWLLAAEYSRVGIRQIPKDAAASAAAANERVRAERAAWIGAIRGELWTEYAYTYADLLWGNTIKANLSSELQQAQVILNRALEYAPDQSGAWLLLAGLASVHPLPGVRGLQALKMSYYTGPSELDLLPLRLRIALRMSDVRDPELRQLIGRDVALLVKRHELAAMGAAETSASPAGKRLMEEILTEVDPSILRPLSSGPRKLQ
jgi:hypothetical protein